MQENKKSKKAVLTCNNNVIEMTLCQDIVTVQNTGKRKTFFYPSESIINELQKREYDAMVISIV